MRFMVVKMVGVGLLQGFLYYMVFKFFAKNSCLMVSCYRFFFLSYIFCTWVISQYVCARHLVNGKKNPTNLLNIGGTKVKDII